VQWVMDNEGNNLQINSRWEQTTGFSSEQTRNMGWLNALHDEDVEPTKNALMEAPAHGKPH